ncbi:hypothetical protein BH11PLA1_BH11PLA1_00590 [soil metagenome]
MIAILCLVAFGLGQTLFAFMGVLCTDASGQSRIEYACIKTGEGRCLVSCTNGASALIEDDHDEDSSAPPEPCEDQPLSQQFNAAKIVPQGISFDTVLATFVVAVLCDTWSSPLAESVWSGRATLDPERPPDSLARLRTIILIV